MRIVVVVFFSQVIFYKVLAKNQACQRLGTIAELLSRLFS